MTPAELRDITFKAVLRAAEFVKSHPQFEETRWTQRWSRWILDGTGGARSDNQEREIHSVLLLNPEVRDRLRSDSATLALSEGISQVPGVERAHALDLCFQFIGRVLAEMPIKLEDLAARFEEVYPDFESDILIKPELINLRSVAPLRGVILESDNLDLTDGLAIRRCDDRLLRQFQGSADPFPWSRMISDPVGEHAAYAVELRSAVVKEGAFPPENANWPFEQLAVSARLFVRSAFYICRIQCPSPHSFRYGGRSWSAPPFYADGPMRFGPPGPPLLIRKADEAPFVAAFKEFVSFCKGPPLPLFLRWFAKGSYERDSADRILDLMVCLESLVLQEIGAQDRGELKFRLSLRLGWFLGTDKAHRTAIFKRAKDHYDLRSRLVHGGDAGIPPDELTKKADDLEELTRMAINRWITAKVAGQPINWTEVVLG